MVNVISRALKDATTGIDGESFDVGRISWIITTLAIIALAVYMIYMKYTLSILDFGGALAANCTAHGAALKFKSGTEPQA